MKSPAVLNSQLQNITQMINYLLGHSGSIRLNSDLDMNGNNVKNTGAPTDPNDVVSAIFAQKNYGAQALLPHFEALGSSIMQTYRQLNNPVQRENYSSFLNGVLNTAPTANTAIVTSTTGGGVVNVTISSGLHQRVDNSVVPFASRTDTFPLPASLAIVSIARVSGVVTVTFGSPFPGISGQSVGISGVGDTSFNGVFEIATVVGNTITYLQVGQPDASSSGGTASLLNVYYYTITRGHNHLGLTASSTADTWSARTAASTDGTTIVAVVIVNSTGVDNINSAAGATPPVTGASVPVIRRM